MSIEYVITSDDKLPDGVTPLARKIAVDPSGELFYHFVVEGCGNDNLDDVTLGQIRREFQSWQLPPSLREML